MDASAIDSHVLAVALRDRPQLHTDLRIIGSFGPSSIQPVVARAGLPVRLKRQVREALTRMRQDAVAAGRLDRALVQCFVAVSDRTYDDIRHMRTAGKAVGLLRTDGASAGVTRAIEEPSRSLLAEKG